MQRATLFSRSWHDVHSNLVRRAVQDVEQLDRRLFLDPALAGHLQKIVAKHKVNVATVTSDGIEAEASSVSGQGSDYGRPITVTHKVLRVSIPIKGDPETVTIAPSTHTLLAIPHELIGTHIFIIIADDERAQSEIEDFIKTVNENLDTLRQEIQRYDGQIAKAVNDAAERRKAEIEADKKRDEGRKIRSSKRSSPNVSRKISSRLSWASVAAARAP